MGSIKASVWSLLSGGFVYAEMTSHVIWANWLAIVWIAMFAWQLTVSTDKKSTTGRNR